MSEARIQLDGDMSGCYCGEFDRPTIAPDEFGETCFHERDKCEVPPVPVSIETVLRLTRARAEKAEAAIQRVRDVCDLWQRRYDSSIRHPTDIPAVAIVAVRRALDGER